MCIVLHIVIYCTVVVVRTRGEGEREVGGGERWVKRGRGVGAHREGA